MSIPTINDITLDTVNVPSVYVPNWAKASRVVDHLTHPVVIHIGNPIVDMPGCVKMHPDNRIHKSGWPIDRNLVENDPDKAMILCDATMPFYDAMNYEPEQLIIVRETPVPNVRPPQTPDSPNVPDTGNVSPKEEIPCPGPNQLRVGDVTQSGDERVVGHRLLEDGKTCETLYEPTTVIEKYVPPLNQVSNVTTLAVVATAGAAATPLLIRVIKPVVKKIWTTIQKKLGKKIKEPSRLEKMTNNYRQKKGLPPLKKK